LEGKGMSKIPLGWKVLLVFFLAALFPFCCSCSSKKPIRWSFAVVADPRSNGDSFRNALTQIRDMKFNPDPKYDPAEFILVAGDIDPIVERYNDYRQVFVNSDHMKAFFPVKGNHDRYDEIAERYIVDNILPEQPALKVRDNDNVNYYFQWKNAYFIIIDGYSDLGDSGCINSMGKSWVKQVIESAPSSIDHIFISFHEPAFPRYRHVGDSFDACPDDRNLFWNMLVEYRDRVRAVFVGHTHSYSRMRVGDPAGDCVNEDNCFPDDANGIYHIDAGAAGNGDRNTIVQDQIEGKNVFFRTIDADNGKEEPFSLKDKWKLLSK
jgi:hypothetical protein